jgi:hypothetical protein
MDRGGVPPSPCARLSDTSVSASSSSRRTPLPLFVNEGAEARTQRVPHVRVLFPWRRFGAWTRRRVIDVLLLLYTTVARGSSLADPFMDRTNHSWLL